MAPGAPLSLEIIGAGPAYTDRPEALGAAYLVHDGDTAVLLDLGQGAFPRLAQAIEPSALDAILVSHLHPDHFIDLVSLRHYLRWEFEPDRHVRVIAPAGLGERLDALHAEPGFAAATLDIEDLRPGSLSIGSLQVSATRVTHTEDSYAIRVGRGHGTGVVYTGDCGRAEDVDGLLRSGDTLLAEVSFGPGPVTPGAFHLDGPAVGELATRGEAGAVLLTHLQMGFDADATVTSVRDRYNGPVTLVVPGDRFDFGD